jgi:nucleotide-binding universal stress UspA family protein
MKTASGKKKAAPARGRKKVAAGVPRTATRVSGPRRSKMAPKAVPGDAGVHHAGAPAPGDNPSPASPPPESSLHIARILVPIDFSVHSKNALKYAVPLAEQFQASLRLVFVVEPTIYPADLGFGQVVLPGVEEELRQKAAEELNGLIEREIGTRVKAAASVRTGSPHREILDEAEEQDVDLIIVATHGHSGVEQILFGSTADRIVHHAHCPVLTVRPLEE